MIIDVFLLSAQTLGYKSSFKWFDIIRSILFFGFCKLICSLLLQLLLVRQRDLQIQAPTHMVLAILGSGFITNSIQYTRISIHYFSLTHVLTIKTYNPIKIEVEEESKEKNKKLVTFVISWLVIG